MIITITDYFIVVRLYLDWVPDVAVLWGAWYVKPPNPRLAPPQLQPCAACQSHHTLNTFAVYPNSVDILFIELRISYFLHQRRRFCKPKVSGFRPVPYLRNEAAASAHNAESPQN